MSGDSPSRRFDVVAETRRRWSQAEKLTIVEEASGVDTNVSAVARRHGIKPALLFRWRREFANSIAAGDAKRAASAFVPIVLPPACGAPEPESPRRASPRPAGDARDSGIEIELTNGRRVRVGTMVDTAALARIVDALEDR